MVDRIRFDTVSYLPFYYIFFDFQFLLLTIFNLQAKILAIKDTLKAGWHTHLEGHDFQAAKARGHGQDPPAVGGIVEVLAGVGVGHPRGVPPHDVEVGPSGHSGLGVPLHFGGPRVHHWGGEDGQHRRVPVQNTFFQHWGEEIIRGKGKRWIYTLVEQFPYPVYEFAE